MGVEDRLGSVYPVDPQQIDRDLEGTIRLAARGFAKIFRPISGGDLRMLAIYDFGEDLVELLFYGAPGMC